MSNKKTILIFSILILVLLIALFLSKNTENKDLQNLTISEEIITQIKSTDDSINIQNKDDASFRWIKNDYTILVSATDNFFINKQSGEYLEFDIVPELFKKELSIVKKVLKDKSFVLDLENSSSDFSDRSFYDYIQSYKKDSSLCVVKVNPDNIGYYQLNFSCGDSLDEAYEEQIPFLEALGLKDKNTVIRLKNQEGNYYEVGFSGVRGGLDAVLKKENNSYRVLYIGQEAPDCSLIEKENIPNETLSSIGKGDCFNDDGSYKKR
ncbi:hypothetical protein ACFL05_00010 [Patescibacteria group bacterium]